jgi:hypothetical protein
MDVANMDVHALLELHRHLAERVVALCFPKFPEKDVEAVGQGGTIIVGIRLSRYRNLLLIQLTPVIWLL